MIFNAKCVLRQRMTNILTFWRSPYLLQMWDTIGMRRKYIKYFHKTNMLYWLFPPPQPKISCASYWQCYSTCRSICASWCHFPNNKINSCTWRGGCLTRTALMTSAPCGWCVLPWSGLLWRISSITSTWNAKRQRRKRRRKMKRHRQI